MKKYIVCSLFIFLFITLAALKLFFTKQISQFVSPLATRSDSFDSIRAKLRKKQSTYTLTSPRFLLPTAHAAGDFDNASSYIVTDFTTGDILYKKNESNQLPIASLTKLMSAVVSLDLLSPDTALIVTPKAATEEPTIIGVVAGQHMTLSELLHAALMTSANDAIEVIRDAVDKRYGSGTFVRAMNEKADFLKLTNTHFTNPQGFDDAKHYSSAEDLALLTHYAVTNYPLIADIVKSDYQFLPASSTHKQFDLYNWNGLLDVYPGAMGVKIGNTDRAAMTTVVLTKRNNTEILTVLLGAPTIIDRDLWAAELLDLGFEKTANLPPVNISEQQLRAKYSTWKYF